jgi:hypothetical protein
MITKTHTFLITLVVLSLAGITAICLHSLEEIHYLKSFFPSTFTVQEACYAGILELIKVGIITFPLVLLIAVCLVTLRRKNEP